MVSDVIPSVVANRIVKFIIGCIRRSDYRHHLRLHHPLQHRRALHWVSFLRVISKVDCTQNTPRHYSICRCFYMMRQPPSVTQGVSETECTKRNEPSIGRAESSDAMKEQMIGSGNFVIVYSLWRQRKTQVNPSAMTGSCLWKLNI